MTILVKDGDLQNDLEAKIMCVFFTINRLKLKTLFLDILPLYYLSLSSNIINCNYIEINTKTCENYCL